MNGNNYENLNSSGLNLNSQSSFKQKKIVQIQTNKLSETLKENSLAKKYFREDSKFNSRQFNINNPKQRSSLDYGKFASNFNLIRKRQNETNKNSETISPTKSITKALIRRNNLYKLSDKEFFNEVETKFQLIENDNSSSSGTSSSNSDSDCIKLVGAVPRTSVMKNDYIDRVFWTKEKMREIRKRLKTAKAKITEKTRKDFDKLFEAICKKDKDAILYNIYNIRNTLQDSSFKSFYPNELKEKNILINLLTNNLGEVLIEVLKDSFYKFDKRYIVTLINETLLNDINSNKQ
jgi:hypothetical protein